ncbi:beta strand repeat-containing protein, partial [Variovorax sp. JS1663]|uniref:beta strand repeat-containing protein n=1 Tax=Variovorax sp. JS1663 TaxID=1851577 RepID=UPI001EE0CF0C
MATGNASITNAGSIGGGLDSIGTTRANAVDLTGGNNRLTLQSGYSFTGNVVSNSGAANGGQNWSIADGTLQGDANTFAGNISFAPASPTSNPGVVFDQGSGNANSAVSATYAGAVSGAGSLTKIGDGTLTLSGANTYSGGTTVTGGTLSVSADQNLGATSGVLTLDGGRLRTTAAVTMGRDITIGSAGGGFQTDADLTSTGVISGAGGLTKTGTGTLTLSGANTYTGTTTVNAGTLRAIANNVFGSGSAVGVKANATLDLNGFDQTVGSLAGLGNVTLGSGTLTSGGNNTTTLFGGQISGSGGLTKTGSGVLALAGANTYTGATIVNAGILRAVSANSAFGNGSAITVNANATLDLSGFSETVGSLAGSGLVTLTGGSLTNGGNNADTIFSGQISGSGGLTKTGTGTLTLAGASTYSGGTTISAGTLQIGNGGSTGSLTGNVLNNATLAFNRSDTMSFTGAISGSGDVIKAGAGTLILTGTNSYAGGTAFNGGVVSISDNAHLGNTAGGLAFNGGTLQTTADLTMNRATTLDALGGTIDTLAGTAMTHQGAIDGAGGLTKTGAGMLTLTGTNTYTGTTTVNAGTLLLGNEAALGVVSTNAAIVNAGGTLDLGGQRIQPSVSLRGGTLANSIGDGGLDGALDLGTGATNTIHNSGAGLTLWGALGGDGNVAIAGSGSVNYRGTNTYTGRTTINAGATLTTEAAGVGAGSGIINNGALILEQRTGSGTVRQAISGSGTVTKSGFGTIVTLTGANTYTGATTIGQGSTLQAGAANTFSAASAVTLDGGATLDLNNYSQTLGSLAGDGFVTLGDSGAGILTVGADNSSTLYQGYISGSGGLTKVGTGTLTLARDNTYTGVTTINDGTLALASNNALGASTVIVNGGTLQADTDLTASGSVIGDGALTKTGAGRLTLTGTNTYTGGTIVAGGTLSVATNQNLGDAAGSLALNGGTLQNTAAFTTGRDITIDSAGGGLQTDADLTSTGVVSGAGGLTKTGAGTLTLSGENTYSGGTDLKEGGVAVRNNRALGSG